MDPIVALAQIREAYSRWEDTVGDLSGPAIQAGADMRDGIVALDEWMSRGGFSPWAMPSPGEMETIEHFPGLR